MLYRLFRLFRLLQGMDDEQLRCFTITALVTLGQGLKLQLRSAPDPDRKLLLQRVIQILKEKTAAKPIRDYVSDAGYTLSIAYP